MMKSLWLLSFTQKPHFIRRNRRGLFQTCMSDTTLWEAACIHGSSLQLCVWRLFILLIVCGDSPVLVGVQRVEEIVTAVLLRRVRELQDRWERGGREIRVLFAQRTAVRPTSSSAYNHLLLPTGPDRNSVEVGTYLAERRVGWSHLYFYLPVYSLWNNFRLGTRWFHISEPRHWGLKMCPN